jgi:hypothetical protein
MAYNIYVYNNGVKTVLHEADNNSRVKAIGKIKKQVNATDSLSLTIYKGNPAFDAIQPRVTLIEVYDASDGRRTFRGRILKPTNAMDVNGVPSKSYVCTGELNYLNESIQPYQQANGGAEFIRKAIAIHNQQMPADKQIQVGMLNILPAKDCRSHTWHYVTTMQAIVDYVRQYGGEYRLRYDGDTRYFDYTSTVWDTGSDTMIELAVNMRSVSVTLDATNIASGIYAVGAKLHNDGTSAERLELGEVIWNEDLRAEYGDIVTCQTWDDVTTAAALRAKATEWLTNQSGVLHQYTVDAVELNRINKQFDSFEVGTQYAIKNPLIGLDDVVRCVSKEIDINDDTKSTLTFGDRYETLSALLSTRMAGLNTKIDKTAEDITSSQEAYAEAIVKQQTDLLRGAEGGYRYDRLNDEGKPYETFYLNAPTIETATSALRINRNGIGFWKGQAGGAIDGTYTSAWTINGVFNTDYIVGRAITGFTFNNGDGTFVVNANGSVTAKALSIVNGTINCGNGKFIADSAGNVSAQAINITGGTINISTADDKYQVIKLNSAWNDSSNVGECHNEMMPAGTEMTYKNTPAGGSQIKYYADYGADGISLSTKEVSGGWEIGTNITADIIDCWHDITVRKTSSSTPYHVWNCINTLFERTGGVPIDPEDR